MWGFFAFLFSLHAVVFAGVLDIVSCHFTVAGWSLSTAFAAFFRYWLALFHWRLGAGGSASSCPAGYAQVCGHPCTASARLAYFVRHTGRIRIPTMLSHPVPRDLLLYVPIFRLGFPPVFTSGFRVDFGLLCVSVAVVEFLSYGFPRAPSPSSPFSRSVPRVVLHSFPSPCLPSRCLFAPLHLLRAFSGPFLH